MPRFSSTGWVRNAPTCGHSHRLGPGCLNFLRERQLMPQSKGTTRHSWVLWTRWKPQTRMEEISTRFWWGRRHELIAPGSQVIVIPDGSLDKLNFETLMAPEPKLHYWIEDVTITNASSLRLLAVAHSSSKRARGETVAHR